MALRVWLPLNGNTNNYGLSENLTQTNTPSYVDGKMGKAMSTGSLSMTAQQAKEVFNAKEMSFCFWIYVSSNWTGGRILFGNEGMAAPNNRKFSIFQYPKLYIISLSDILLNSLLLLYIFNSLCFWQLYLVFISPILLQYT